MNPPRVPLPGDVVADKYVIGRMLGKGGMGVVLEAKNRKLDSRVAIKFLQPDALDDKEAVKRFDREARAAALLTSPFVVRVLDVDATSEGLPFIVMEYVEGHDLMSELRDKERIPVTDAVDWVLQACAGLAHAHARGILHRDIKPSNLFLCNEATGPVVKLMDFGVSKIVLQSMNETEITTTETTVGTPTYMAPEQLVSSRTVDHRADLWSLGVVLYRMLSGILPFRGPNPTATAIAIATTRAPNLGDVAPWIPPELVAVVMRALDPDMAGRQEDVIAFGRAIEHWGSGRFAFESAIAGVPPPATSSARNVHDPQRTQKAPAPLGVSGSPLSPGLHPSLADEAPTRTAPMPALVPRTDPAEAAGSAKTSLAIPVAAGLGILFAIATLVVVLALRPRPKPPITTTTQPSASASSELGAMPLPPVVTLPMTPASAAVSVTIASSAPPTTSTSVKHGPVPPVKPPPRPPPTSPPNTTARPPDDPLHL